MVPVKNSGGILARANKASSQLVEVPVSNHFFVGELAIETVTVVTDWLLRHGVYDPFHRYHRVDPGAR